ncbi:exocyst complex component 2 [Ischnura elegans]|uniref:exocyst complex component 2 n=1 Tax=Ischnura elegans TaxID=197161 RepID=UPI001ED8A54C|nr:exocyst complex component 2 [Ischnura elegans]
MAPPPIVTGISPKEGPPGTRVTLRGEYLGSSPTDLIGLTICGCDCLLSAEWKSVNKIIARSGPGKGRGDIIITTRSGGKGTSTVQFRGYHETIGPMKESAVWVEDAPLQNLAWGSRRSLSPTTYQYEDPLGISAEGNEKKFPEDDLHELFPEGAMAAGGGPGPGKLTSEHFIPAWFLLENHHTTSFEDLKAGLSFLRRRVDAQKEGQLSFLKANVGAVMDQLDTIVALKERFEADMKQLGPDPTAKAEQAIKESERQATELFREVLGRREKAEAIRNALGVLQRHRFLFALPSTIERNIRRGEYDLVINDYMRARSLFGSTDVPVFCKVFEEVDRRIDTIRAALLARLRESVPAPLEEQKKIIKNLVSFEVEGDPGWEAIQSRHQHLLNLLRSCKNEHLSSSDPPPSSDLDGKTLRGMSPSKFVKTPTTTSSQEFIGNSSGAQGLAPPGVLFVEALTDALWGHFPDLWRLGQAYFSGELHVPSNPSRHSEYKNMVMEAVRVFCDLIRGALLPPPVPAERLRRGPAPQAPVAATEPGGWVGAWLPHCIRHVRRQAYEPLVRLDLPSEALDAVTSLLFDLRLCCMVTLFRHATEGVRSLHRKETWRMEMDERQEGITDLPLRFESRVREVVQLVKESALVGERGEIPLAESTSACKELTAHIQALLCAFPQTLEHLTFGKDAMRGAGQPAVSQLIGSPAAFDPYRGGGGDSNTGSMQGGSVNKQPPPWETRLLITMSNCVHTRTIVLPRLGDLFKKQSYPGATNSVPGQQWGPMTISAGALEALEKRIFEAYLEAKSDPLVGTIEPSMYLGHMDWGDHLPMPIDVRPYAKEAIGNMIGVHAEVHRVSPSLVPRLLSQITETVAEELARLLSCVSHFSREGGIQARSDVCAIQEALGNYVTPVASGFFEEALEALPELKDEEDIKRVDVVLANFRARMRVQLICFVGGGT